jgi:hypothetical protein
MRGVIFGFEDRKVKSRSLVRFIFEEHSARSPQGADFFRATIFIELRDQTALLSLVRPYDAEEMEGYEVSRAVNSPLNDGPECVRPVDVETARQRRLL